MVADLTTKELVHAETRRRGDVLSLSVSVSLRDQFSLSRAVK
jgi:hypothetical protein